MTIADRALEFVRRGDTLGLGSGHAAATFVRALAARVAAGLDIRAIPTSVAIETQARQLGIPLIGPEEIRSIDVAVDGADEVDPHLNLIKGYGGALLREKVIDRAARRLVILVGAEKLVPVLGTRGKVPLEVVPFAVPFCRRRLLQAGYRATPRAVNGRLFVTDNGNHLLDCTVETLDDPAAFDRLVRSIPGIVETGLFLDMAHIVLVQDGDQVHVCERRKQ